MTLIAPPHRLVTEPGPMGLVTLGMPHLTPQGLSESWLLKHLGDVHWQMIAARIRRPAAGIEDVEGRRVYAAFRQLRLEGARFEEAREDDVLVVDSALWRLTRTQLISQHRLTAGGRGLGTVTLVSAFIRREGGSNRRVCRVEVPGLAELPGWGGLLPERATAPHDLEEAADFTFTPCPSEDFNGAGFLYFPSYVAIAERALFASGAGLADGVLRERTVHFHANLDAGDSVRVTTQRSRAGDGHVVSQLRRASDGAAMADIVTRRAARP